MQRVRVGLTGLACVFLLVFLAAAFFGLARPDAAISGAEDPAAPRHPGNATAEPREPLAELGVTPGNLPGKVETPAVPDLAAPAPAAANLPGAPSEVR